MPVTLPCGRCIGCKLEKSKQWAIRCMHEASLYEKNCYITLTFDNKHLDPDKSLRKRHFQLFMKKLRKRYGYGIRYYHSGEYGEDGNRPHHHAILFNFDLPDKILYHDAGENSLYTSAILEEIWGNGMCTVGAVTFDSAAYVARYVAKKITGDAATFHYTDFNLDTGEILHEREPEFSTMSKQDGGIGAKWMEKYHSDVYNYDCVIRNGIKLRPPKYYDKLYEKIKKSDMDVIKLRRRVKADSVPLSERTTERLLRIEKFLKARFKQKKGTL